MTCGFYHLYNDLPQTHNYDNHKLITTRKSRYSWQTIHYMYVYIYRYSNAPFYYNGLTLILPWLSNHTSAKVWDEIIYPFANFSGCTVEVWELIGNFIPHIITDIINYPCC